MQAIKTFTEIILSKTFLLAFFSFGKEEKAQITYDFRFFVSDVRVGQAVIYGVS